MLEVSATALIGGMVLLMVPIMLAALGEVIIERSGTLNISIEGVMLSGAFVAAAALQWGVSPWIAVLVAVPSGVLIGALLSWIYVIRRVNQIVGGILFNLLALGLTTMLYVSYFSASTTGSAFESLRIPFLADVPVLGPALFDQPAFVYIAVLLAFAVHYLLFSTWFGLHVRAAGERPVAVDSSGVDVNRVRMMALVIGSVLIVLAGAALVVLHTGTFTPGITAGKGFIAMAIAMVARWKPLLTIPVAALFGLAEAFQFHAQILGLSVIPPQVWAMLPYLITIVAVVIGRAARYPAAIGAPYLRAGVG